MFNFTRSIIEVEEELQLANEKLLAADTNAALTCINIAISNLKIIREELKGN